MKAMILAAGLGTRLRPLTDNIPKALVKFGNKTLLELAIDSLRRAGYADLIINLHHFPDQIKKYLEKNRNFDVNISYSDESDELLDSGGGIKKASWFFDDHLPFMVYNVDVVTDLDLRKPMQQHQSSLALATLVVRKRETQRYFLFDKENQLLGWKNTKTGEIKGSGEITDDIQMLAFSGIHVISPEIFSLMENKTCFSIIDTYIRLSSHHIISAYLHDDGFWADGGKPANIPGINDFLKTQR